MNPNILAQIAIGHWCKFSTRSPDWSRTTAPICA